MGYLFEELIRKFSEQSNETAGEHFTPREVIRLIVDLLIANDDAKLTGRAVEIPHDEAVRTMAAYFAERGIDAPAEGHLFRIELETVVVVFVEDDELVIDRWSEAEGRVTVRRS